MTCRGHRDAIFDLARGEPVPHAVAQAAEAHLADCRACQAAMRRQQALTQALSTLADDARGWTTTDELDQRVLSAVAAKQANAVELGRHSSVVSSGAHVGRRRRAFVSVAGGLAAAAGIVLAVSLVSNRREERPALPVPTAAAPSGGPAVADRAMAAGADAAEHATPHVVRSRPAAARRGAPRAQPAAKSFEFVEIPGAAGLPVFESGAIVRLELPVAALPSYGVAIAPDAHRLLVEADVLVGQDGQMRGIRLVSPEPEAAASRSRQ